MKESFSGEIVLKNLKKEEISEFLRIEFDSFYKMMVLIFGGNINGGLKIRKREIEANLHTLQYFVAKVGEEIVGTIEIISQDAIKKYKKNFKEYFENIGLVKALKAYYFEISPYKMDDKTMYIDTVAVDKRFRRKGIAKKMLELTNDIGKRMNKEFLTLWVAKENLSALHLYKTMGYKEIKRKSSKMLEKRFLYREWVYLKKEIR